MIAFNIFLWLIQRTAISLGYMLIGKAFLKMNFSVKKWLLGGALVTGTLIVDYFTEMKAHIFFHIAEYVFYSHYIYGQPWKKSWQGTVMLFAVCEFAEVLLVLTQDLWFTAEDRMAFDNTKLFTWPCLKLNNMAALMLLIVAGLCMLGRKAIPQIVSMVLNIPLWLRITLAAVEMVLIGLWYWIVSDNNVYGGTDGFFVMFISFMVILSLLAGIIRDIFQSRLDRRNRALGASQQSIAQFLFEMRAFRHDIANMLYGWQGVLLEGDVDRIRQYNTEMNYMFSMINNDNALNLQKLGSGSVRRLLNEKLRSAELNGVPASLLVEGVYDRFKMKESDLCRVLGVLTDNAVGAALGCDCPTVHIHIFREDGNVRFLVRNTANEGQLEAMRPGFERTEAEEDLTGEHGIGLKSARETISRYSKTELFIYSRGRYVEACLSLPA